MYGETMKSASLVASAWPRLQYVVVIAVFNLIPSCSVRAETVVPTTGKKDLYIIGLFPWSGAWQGGESLMASATIALKQVNDMDVVPGYSLNIVPWDTKCDPGLGIRGLFENIYRPPTKLLIMGAGCSFVSEATARAAHHWNLVQVSYASVSPALSDKASFPLFARLSAPDTVTNPARVRFLQNYGWTRIATIHQTYELFSKTTEDLIQQLKVAGFTITRSEIFSQDPTFQVQNLKENDCRIIIGAFYVDKARKVMCQAFKRKLFGPRVVWILTGWYDSEWWLQPDPAIDCTPAQMAEVVEGYFDAGIVYISPHNTRTVSGWLPSDWSQAYKSSVGNRSLPGDNMAPQGYDTVWALALALNATRQQLLDAGSSRRLEDFSYNDTSMAQMIYANILNLSFSGVRGPIAFDSKGDPLGLVKLDRVQGGVKNTIGYYNYFTSGLEMVDSNPILWKNKVPPRDAPLMRLEYQELSKSLYATMCTLAALGILLALTFLAFNILLRDIKLVKMSSPRINNVILLGCILCYVSVFVKDVGGEHGVLGCQMRAALLSVGISMALGALFAKTWRVHVIFTNPTLERRLMSDRTLLVMVSVVALLNILVLLAWWFLDPICIRPNHVSTSMAEDIAGEVEVGLSEMNCVSENKVYYLGTLYAIHAVVLLTGTFLAYETRHVHYPELNDSKYIGLCVYNVALLSVPAVVLGVAMDPTINLKYAIGSCLVLIGTTVTQCLIFLPKVSAYRYNSVLDVDSLRTVAHGTISGTTSPKVAQTSMSGTASPSSVNK